MNDSRNIFIKITVEIIKRLEVNRFELCIESLRYLFILQSFRFGSRFVYRYISFSADTYIKAIEPFKTIHYRDRWVNVRICRNAMRENEREKE